MIQAKGTYLLTDPQAGAFPGADRRGFRKEARMSLFSFAALERSLVQGARTNAAQAVRHNERMAELRRQAASAQSDAEHRADDERRAPR